MRRNKPDRRRAEFEALLEPHLDALYGTALRMTRSPQEADDLLQESCLKAWRFIDRYQAGTNFKAWIFKILTNVFNSRYRKHQRDHQIRRQVEQDGHQTHVLGQGPAREAQSAESTILDHLLSEDIREAIGQLPPEFRMAVLLSDVEEFSYKEIAEIMDCPVGTVMSRLYRARRQLQQLLHEHAVDRGIVEAAPTTSVPEDAPGGRDEQAAVMDLADYRSRRQR